MYPFLNLDNGVAWYATAVALVCSAFAATGMAFVWGVASRRHWFIRSAEIAGVLCLVLSLPGPWPHRAWDLFVTVLVQATVVVTTALLVRGGRWLFVPTKRDRLSLPRPRFMVRDLLLAAVVAAVAAAVFRQTPNLQEPLKPLVVAGLLAGAGTVAVAGVFWRVGRRLSELPDRPTWPHRFALGGAILVCLPAALMYLRLVFPAPIVGLPVPVTNGYEVLIRDAQSAKAVMPNSIWHDDNPTPAEYRQFLEDVAPILVRTERNVQLECVVPIDRYDGAEAAHAPILRRLARSIEVAADQADRSGNSEQALRWCKLGLNLADRSAYGGAMEHYGLAWSNRRRTVFQVWRMRQSLSVDELKQLSRELALGQERESLDVLMARFEAWEVRRDGWRAAVWWTMCNLPWLRSLEVNDWPRRLHDQTWAWQRLVAVSLAIEAYRRDRGELPDGLDALVPTYLDRIPQDPFSGRTFAYRPHETDYLLYSLGEDRDDDGGRRPQGIPIHGGIVDGDLLLPAP